MHTRSDPQDACAAPNDPSHVGAPSTPSSVYAVLWVERETPTRSAIANMLQQLGHRVTFVPDAFQAMNVVAEDLRAFDVVIMDSDLPDLDAVELAHYLRSARGDWRLLLCCGADAEWMHDWVQEAEFPCDALLVKPVDGAQLELTLRRTRAEQTLQPSAAPEAC